MENRHTSAHIYYRKGARTSPEVELMENSLISTTAPLPFLTGAHFSGSGTNGKFLRRKAEKQQKSKARTSPEVELMEK